ncbi:hypothetical protein BC834DRAFT_831117, partial [Gloeopeniophorella convolvens]
AIGLAAMYYDYFLTLGDEIEYIWTTPRTTLNTVFLVLRYGVGSCNLFFVYNIMIQRLYTLWDRRPHVIKKLVAGYCVTVVSFDVFALILTLLNAAERPRKSDEKIIEDLQRDGLLFYLVRATSPDFDLVVTLTGLGLKALFGSFTYLQSRSS